MRWSMVVGWCVLVSLSTQLTAFVALPSIPCCCCCCCCCCCGGLAADTPPQQTTAFLASRVALTSSDRSSSSSSNSSSVTSSPQTTQTTTSTTTTTTTTTAIHRAKEIFEILFWHTLVPLSSTLVSFNNHKDFWARKIGRTNVSNAQQLVHSLEDLGPTFVKFGQALSAREDLLPSTLCDALCKLQCEMAPTMSMEEARAILTHELVGIENRSNIQNQTALTWETVWHSLEPVAAASIGQVYKAQLPNYGTVAIKVQRPGMRQLVDADETLLKTIAAFVQDIRIIDDNNNNQRWMATRVVDGVEEFMSRVKEELDYRNEACNMVKFATLYGDTTNSNMNVVVPKVHTEYCTDTVLVMEWLDGTKLTEFQAQTKETDQNLEENLAVLACASAATLSQLFETGVLHADPHAGNLLKIKDNKGHIALGYLDFGMISEIPTSVRDGLVCAVAQCIFARNISAVVDLFGELQLLQGQTLDDPNQRAALIEAMEDILNTVFTYPTTNDGNETDKHRTPIPQLRFDSLLGGLTRLVTRFEFSLPPYFLNNVRALATLEGITRKLNPNTNSMTAVYPFALKRLLGNPSNSRVVEDTILDLVCDSQSGRRTVSKERLDRLLGDAASYTGRSRRRVILDVMQTRGGRKLIRKLGWKLLWRRKRKKERPQ